MSKRFFYLYLTSGSIFLLLLIYQLIVYYPSLNALGVAVNVLFILALYYLAYKVRREKEDKDLM
jgi:uncharacterized membrane protein (DUF2068 family)